VSHMSNFYVEFEIGSEAGFEKLVALYAALREAKINDDWKDDDYWLRFIDENSRKYFSWPTEAESEDWRRRWFSMPIETRLTDPSLRRGWQYGSMIEAFRNGDYGLLECRKVSQGRARIEFDPYGHPYGGTGCMQCLAEAFGHRVVEVRE
jgi:hypothetical protein